MKKKFYSKPPLVQINKAALFVFASILLFSFCTIIGKFAYHMIIIDKDKSILSSSTTSLGYRGDIRDRNGSLLATQSTYYDLIYAPKSKNNTREKKWVAEVFALFFNLPVEHFHKKFEVYQDYTRFKRKITDEEVARLHDCVNIVNQKIIDEYKQIAKEEEEEPKNIPTLNPQYFLDSQIGRSYPKGELASQIIGFVNLDGIAQEGVERIYNDDLSTNKVVDGININRDIYLTIDTQIQYMAAKQTKKAIEEHQAEAAIFIVMDATSGEILAMENAPSFNPNFFRDSSSESRMNRAISYAYEPGSVFKIFTVACAFDTNRIPLNQTLYCQAAYQIPGTGNPPAIIKCVTPHGTITPKDSVVLSCNTAACTSTECLSNSELYAKLSNFGFGKKTNLGLLNENRGLLRKPSRWSARSLATVTMGQEISATALQIVTAATVFANEGRLLKPHIIKSIRDSDGTIHSESQISISQEVLSYDTVKYMLKIMSEGTDHGLAKKTDIEGIRLASKTGTAQIFDSENGRYYDDKYVASVLTLFPAEKPRFIIYGAVFAPQKGSIYGSQVTAPLVRNLAEDLILYLNVYKETDSLYEVSNVLKVQQEGKISISKNKMPHLIGRSKRDLINLYSRNFKLNIKGEGKVVRQSPLPGETISEGTIIHVELE